MVVALLGAFFQVASRHSVGVLPAQVVALSPNVQRHDDPGQRVIGG